jgi:glutathione S-transferase
MNPRLVTIAISHFCEKARWALDRAGIDYQEEAHLPLFHYPSSLARARSYSVPVLIHEGGALTSSTAILHWADAHAGSAVTPLYPDGFRDQVEALERRLDERLGPASRLWAYAQLLGERELAMRYAGPSAPAWERQVLTRGYRLATGLLRWRLGGLGVATVMEARSEVVRVFDEVARTLAEGHRYLAADSFTAADLTFAALAAPVLMPRGYGAPLPALHELPERTRLEVGALREHPAGAFAMRLYEEHRGQKP